MKLLSVRRVIALSLLCAAPAGPSSTDESKVFPLTSASGLELVNAKADAVEYCGRLALHLLPPGVGPGADMLAIVNGLTFDSGVIEVDVAGAPRSGVSPEMRGFVGVAFRVQPRGVRYCNLFLRPANGRSDDQLRRNHSVQYQALPDFPWNRLRKESPGVYESYVDLEVGVWTKLKVVVSGNKARLYVNDGDQPCLVVNDLKADKTGGAVALWAHPTTDAYFSRLVVKPAAR
jgi:hypothetical protein